MISKNMVNLGKSMLDSASQFAVVASFTWVRQTQASIWRGRFRTSTKTPDNDNEHVITSWVRASKSWRHFVQTSSWCSKRTWFCWFVSICGHFPRANAIPFDYLKNNWKIIRTGAKPPQRVSERYVNKKVNRYVINLWVLVTRLATPSYTFMLAFKYRKLSIGNPIGSSFRFSLGEQVSVCQSPLSILLFQFDDRGWTTTGQEQQKTKTTENILLFVFHSDFTRWHVTTTSLYWSLSWIYM
jgi:hypothetical protein